MKKLSFTEFSRIMNERAEAIHNGANLKHLTGVIVYKENNWEKKYPIEARSYAVSSNNKAFGSWYCGYSMFGSSLDGSDPCVRLENVNWKIDYCYIKD